MGEESGNAEGGEKQSGPECARRSARRRRIHHRTMKHAFLNRPSNPGWPFEAGINHPKMPLEGVIAYCEATGSH